MSSRIRFACAADVFSAYDDLKFLLSAPTGDVEPLAYAQTLLRSRQPADAIAFLAHLLPRREAVWWARQCAAAILGRRAEDARLLAADAWVREPDDERRQAALKLGEAGNRTLPTTWLALAAGWSPVPRPRPDGKPPLQPASVCARAVNAAIMQAIAGSAPALMSGWIVACVDAGVRFAEGGEARVPAPKLEAEPAQARRAPPETRNPFSAGARA